MACVGSTTPARRLTSRAGSMLTCPRASWCVELETRSPADAARDEEKIRQVRRARLLALDARTPSRTVEPTWLSSHGVPRRALAGAGGSARVGRRSLACWACARQPSRGRSTNRHVRCAVCAAWSPGSRLDGGIVYEESSTRSRAGRAGRRRLVSWPACTRLPPPVWPALTRSIARGVRDLARVRQSPAAGCD